MSQELHVVQCYACETYQTQIVKKSNKWLCKICGEKQSLKKVFGQGSGKDCRVHCQRLNDLRRKKLEKESDIILNIEDLPVVVEEPVKEDMTSPLNGTSKWSKYLSQHSSSEEEDGDLFDLRPSQFVVPSCSPQSMGISQIAYAPFEIPSTKRLKDDNGKAVSKPSTSLMDSDDDDCFSIQLPPSAKSKAFPSIVTSPLCNDNITLNKSKSSFIPKQSTVLQVAEENFSPRSSVSKSSSVKYLAKDNTVCKDQPSKDSINQNSSSKHNKNVEVPKANFNLGFENFLEPQVDESCNKQEMEEHVLISKKVQEKAMETDFTYIESKNHSDKPSARDLKRAISLFEDIDNYSLEQLTKMCDF